MVKYIRKGIHNAVINELHKHEKIALDFDQTLVGHPKSSLLWNFIQKTHLTKTFHIITFRSGAWANEDMLIDDMIRGSNNAIRPYMIESVSFCDYNMYADFSILQSSREQIGTQIPSIILPEETKFFQWKAERAKELGCTILVDDRPAWVKDGCDQHGIIFIDTADLA